VDTAQIIMYSTGLQFKANSQNCEKRLLLRNTTSNEKCT